MKLEIIYDNHWRMPHFEEFEEDGGFSLWNFISKHCYDYSAGKSKNFAFDIGGVLSKYPQLFLKTIACEWISSFDNFNHVYVITDMHNPEQTHKMLEMNGFMKYIKTENVINSDFETYGEACKYVELRKYNIEMFFDDFPAYVSDGCKYKCRVLPDLTNPYYADEWKTDGSEGNFGRRKVMVDNLFTA